MFSLKKRKKSEDTEDANYWLSIGDLMASILIIFTLLFISKTLETGKELQKKETIIENFTSIKKKIIAKLKNEFNKKNIKIDIDPQTGAIKIDDKILFNTGEYTLKSEGKDYLDGFIPVYVNLLLNDKEIKNELSQIIIEGHTDNVGSYIYNMELSQKRAFEVVKYIYTEMKDFEGKSELEKYITANGRSKIKVVKNENGEVNKEKSRRVEFQFKLKEDETLKRIEETLKEGK